MFDEEESKSPLNQQQWYEATNAKNALHQKTMEDNHESREDQIHRNMLLLKIDTIRKIISETSFSNDRKVHLQALDQFISLIENGEQPRKRSLVILNKWWRLYNNI